MQAALPTLLLAMVFVSGPAALADEGEGDLRGEAAAALRKAIGFFRSEVAVRGGYGWAASADLTLQEGEGPMGPTTVWVQPPGTPSIGMAYLEAHEATGEPEYLTAARETAAVLLLGQLESGGWTASIELADEGRRRYVYRTGPREGRSRRARNFTSLDDDTTQAAIRFLVALDRRLDFRDEAVHVAARYALDALLRAQYPNGGWPQGFDPAQDHDRPVSPASYPDAWSREAVGADYWWYYTLNDNLVPTVVDTLLAAAAAYDEPAYREAALQTGDFLVLAQMPDPQPAWAQQYDFDMHPAWARKFEPPAITGGESQGALRTLLTLYRESGDEKFLRPIPPARAYLRRSLLPDGRLARFYELRTNRPLYFTRNYVLTHDDGDVPSHYAFAVTSDLNVIEAEYRRLSSADRKADGEESGRGPPSAQFVDEVRAVVAAMDERGAWVEDGRLRTDRRDPPADRIVRSATFVRNVGVLSRYLRAGE